MFLEAINTKLLCFFFPLKKIFFTWQPHNISPFHTAKLPPMDVTTSLSNTLKQETLACDSQVRRNQAEGHHSQNIQAFR